MSEENKNTEPVAIGQATGQEEKTFTQEEVNRIVQERLARSKGNQGPKSEENNKAADEMESKEAELKAREMNLLAREQLLDAGLAADCLTLLKGVVDENDLKDRIEILKKHLSKKDEEPKPSGFIQIGAPGQDAEKRSDPIRQAMGL